MGHDHEILGRSNSYVWLHCECEVLRYFSYSTKNKPQAYRTIISFITKDHQEVE